MDDLNVTPVGLSSLVEFVVREFSKPDHRPDDPDDIYARSHGGRIFSPARGENAESIDHRADFVENQDALPACRLAAAASAVLS